ncbi:MATE efflux family protein 9 [Platanthera guangdongensis]|uniref:MATE efflux family protein 9 n=1 Tax=Platanthera guangdongensis TaxID=2320717 RepID=A0ABR2LTF1_9ASPA
MILILVRNVWGYAYSNEDEVVKYVAIMLPILALSNVFDGIQSVLSGIARACGLQKFCAFANLGAYYVVGIPSAILFGFVFHIEGKGLWMGIICGLIVQVFLLLAITFWIDWNKQDWSIQADPLITSVPKPTPRCNALAYLPPFPLTGQESSLFLPFADYHHLYRIPRKKQPATPFLLTVIGHPPSSTS